MDEAIGLSNSVARSRLPGRGGNSLKVNEIFYSIQGESSWAGYPCVFVRLTGCNLRCSYCDTQYAYDEGDELAIADIVAQVAAYRCPLVEITGGEPLLQAETPLLVSSLLDNRYRVLLETNGSLDVHSIDHRCIKIIDVKLPSSGETQSNCLQNLALLTDQDELKFVIGNKEDYDYAKQVMNLIPQQLLPKIIVNISPVFTVLSPALLASWILQDHLAVRLNLQLHKILWPSDRRGV
jgi:7-carboxy-7-deazaguanine synthase